MNGRTISACAASDIEGVSYRGRFLYLSYGRYPYGISIPAAYNECLAPEIYMRLNAYGSGVFDSKGNVCLDRPSSLKAYIHLLRSVRSAKPDFRSADDVSIVQDFLNGNTAMLITYPSFLTDVVDLRKSSMVGSIGYHHIPGKSPLLGGWSLGISSRSSRKQEAFSFLKWICDEQTANYFALLGGQSAITSTYTNDERTSSTHGASLSGHVSVYTAYASAQIKKMASYYRRTILTP